MVAKYFDYRNKDLTGKSRKADLVKARHVAMYLLREELGLQLTKVGELMGGRDHTTIMHGVDKIKGEIEIKAEKKNGKAEVSVADAGVGIGKEDMKKLFGVFSRIHVKGTPIQEGTGLGLHLSKKIVDLLGGDIKAESEFGKGSKFTFRLPLEYKGIRQRG